MAVPTVIWHGTLDESFALQESLVHNCDCTHGLMGVRLTTCSSHKLMNDQRALNGLLFMRRYAETLRRQEWLPRRKGGQ